MAGAELASGGQVAPWRIAMAAVASMCAWEAWMSRSGPSDRASAREVRYTRLVLIAAGSVLALALGPANLGLAALTAILAFAYSRTLKSWALPAQFDLGVLAVLAVLFGALAGGSLSATAVPAVLLLCLLVLLHDLSGNQAVGKGYEAPAIATWLAAAWIVTATGLVILTRAGALALSLLGLAIALDLATYLRLWTRLNEISTRLGSMMSRELLFERLIFGCALIAIRAPAAAAFGLLAATMAATIGFQLLQTDTENARP